MIELYSREALGGADIGSSVIVNICHSRFLSLGWFRIRLLTCRLNRISSQNAVLSLWSSG